MVKKLSEKDFEKAKGDAIALVDFSATWCGPCQMLAPIVEQVSAEYEGKVSFYTVDVDECPNLSKEFGIVSIPFLAILKNGTLAEYKMGFMPKENLKAFIENNL